MKRSRGRKADQRVLPDNGARDSERKLIAREHRGSGMDLRLLRTGKQSGDSQAISRLHLHLFLLPLLLARCCNRCCWCRGPCCPSLITWARRPLRRPHSAAAGEIRAEGNHAARRTRAPSVDSELRPARSRTFATTLAILRARYGGTAFPTCVYCAVLGPRNT
jgi:hypothetical protein